MRIAEPPIVPGILPTGNFAWVQEKHNCHRRSERAGKDIEEFDEPNKNSGCHHVFAWRDILGVWESNEATIRMWMAHVPCTVLLSERASCATR